MPKVTVSGFVARMKAGKLAKKRAGARQPKMVSDRNQAVKKRIVHAKKYCVYQTFDGDVNHVCDCKSESMAHDLARHLNISARPGVRFNVR